MVTELSLEQRINRAHLRRLLRHVEDTVDKRPESPISRLGDYTQINEFIKKHNVAPEIYKKEIEAFCNRLLDRDERVEHAYFLDLATLLYNDFLK